jgi:hypothetical protein
MTSMCLQCNARPANSLEHVFLSAVGGRRKVPDVLCQQCNNVAGQTIDARLAESLAGPRMLLQVKGDRKQTATITGTSDRIGDVRLAPGGVPECVPGPPVVERKGTEQTVRFATMKEARAYVRAMRKKGFALKVKSAEIRSVFPAQVEFPMEFGGDDCFRSAAKTALTLMAWRGYDGGAAATELWRYVAAGACPALTANCTFAEKPWPLPRRFEVLSHQVTVERDATGRLRVDVRYFGDIAVALEVDVREEARPWRAGYAADPFTGAETHRTEAISPLIAVPPRSEAAHVKIRAAAKKAMTAILRQWHWSARAAVLRDLWVGLAAGSLTDRWEAVRRFYYTLRRQDHSRAAPHIKDALR